MLSDNFYVFMSKIKIKIILTYFQVKNTFTKYFSPQYQAHTS